MGAYSFSGSSESLGRGFKMREMLSVRMEERVRRRGVILCAAGERGFIIAVTCRTGPDW